VLQSQDEAAMTLMAKRAGLNVSEGWFAQAKKTPLWEITRALVMCIMNK